MQDCRHEAVAGTQAASGVLFSRCTVDVEVSLRGAVSCPASKTNPRARVCAQVCGRHGACGDKKGGKVRTTLSVSDQRLLVEDEVGLNALQIYGPAQDYVSIGAPRVMSRGLRVSGSHDTL